MSEKYYREIKSNKDIIKFKLHLATVLLKLNEHNQNIKDLDSNIKNNDNDIKSKYDICIANKNSLIDIDRKIYAINNSISKMNSDNENINKNITKINSDIEKINKKDITKHNYSIENIWFFNIDIVNVYTISLSIPVVSLFKYGIDSKFTVNSILEIRCNIIYKYGSYNDVGLLKHTYSLLDDKDNLIYAYNIIHTNSGDNLDNHLTMNDDLHILMKNYYPDKLKIKLQVTKAYSNNNNKSVGFRIMNPYKNNILCVKYIKYLPEK